MPQKRKQKMLGPQSTWSAGFLNGARSLLTQSRGWRGLPGTDPRESGDSGECTRDGGCTVLLPGAESPDTRDGTQRRAVSPARPAWDSVSHLGTHAAGRRSPSQRELAGKGSREQTNGSGA